MKFVNFFKKSWHIKRVQLTLSCSRQCCRTFSFFFQIGKLKSVINRKEERSLAIVSTLLAIISNPCLIQPAIHFARMPSYFGLDFDSISKLITAMIPTWCQKRFVWWGLEIYDGMQSIRSQHFLMYFFCIPPYPKRLKWPKHAVKSFLPLVVNVQFKCIIFQTKFKSHGRTWILVRIFHPEQC